MLGVRLTNHGTQSKRAFILATWKWWLLHVIKLVASVVTVISAGTLTTTWYENTLFSDYMDED